MEEEIKCIHCGAVNGHQKIIVDYGDGDVREEKCPDDFNEE